MAGDRRDAVDPVTDRLHSAPGNFDFFAAVTWLIRQSEGARRANRAVGDRESTRPFPIRFESWQARTFPPGDVVRCDPDSGPEGESVWRMVVSFFGLTGPNGVLPAHYTQLVLDQQREHSRPSTRVAQSARPALQDFFDLLNNRQLQLFYSAWRKYRLGEQYCDDETDPVSRTLLSLIGLAAADWSSDAKDPLRNRLQIADRALLYYSGLFSHRPRSAVPLRESVRELTGLPVEIREFTPRKLPLDVRDCTRLGAPDGNCELGRGAMIGSAILSFDTCFRVRLGPLSRQEFLDYQPKQPGLVRLAQYVRTYVGVELDFDVQLVLRAAEVPQTVIGGSDGGLGRLGWSTWLLSRPPAQDAEDVVLVDDGWPLPVAPA
jgi:type VI secretion system protein ImpH